MFRTYGITRTKAFLINSKEKEMIEHEQHFLGYNYRMSDVSAALGINQLKIKD